MSHTRHQIQSPVSGRISSKIRFRDGLILGRSVPILCGLVLGCLAPVLFGLALIGCSQKDSDPPTNSDAGPWVDLVHPADGTTTADTMSVQAHIVSTYELDRLTLLIEGVEIATLFEPPWVFFRDDIAVEDSTWVSLELRAYDRRGGVGASQPIRIQFIPNHAPMTKIIFPFQDHYIVAHSASPRSWQCEAADPDIESVPDEWITWLKDGAGALGNGRVIPAPLLEPGPFKIRVEVRDRWGRLARDHRRVTFFQYPRQDSPENTLSMFKLAVLARDAETIGRLLCKNLLWVFCSDTECDSCFVRTADKHSPNGIDGCSVRTAWGLAAAQKAFKYFLEDTLLRRISWSWRPDLAEYFELDGRRFAKIEVDDLDVTRTRTVYDGSFTIASRNNRARIFLREEEDTWMIWEWISFPPEPWNPDDIDLLALLSGFPGGDESCPGAKLKSDLPDILDR